MDCKGIVSLWGSSCVINSMPFLLCPWVSILSMIAKQAESPLLSAAFWRSRRCGQRNAGASFANFKSLWCAILVCIITTLWEMHLGSKRCKRRQSQIKLRGLGGPSPMTYTLMGARSQHRDNQKSTSGLHLTWHVLNFVQFTLECSLNWTSSLSQLFMRYSKSSSEKESRLE
jgi:hypothetical protein